MTVRRTKRPLSRLAEAKPRAECTLEFRDDLQNSKLQNSFTR